MPKELHAPRPDGPVLNSSNVEMKMGLKLVLRNGVYYVSGTVRLPDGQCIRIRRSTGLPKREKRHAQRVQEDILRNLLVNGQDGKKTGSETLEDVTCSPETSPF
jgi:hypothetical protein